MKLKELTSVNRGVDIYNCYATKCWRSTRGDGVNVARAVMRAVARVNLCSNCCDCNRCLERERSSFCVICGMFWAALVEQLRLNQNTFRSLSTIFA